MGKASRQKPERLAEKLKQIRDSLGLSQDGMLIRLRIKESSKVKRNDVSNFELGVNEPSLIVLLAYARAANIYLDVLADDNIDLPDEIPSKRTSLGKKKRSFI